jgi:hypothetical protein
MHMRDWNKLVRLTGIRFAFCSFLLFAICTPAHADLANLGTLSLDELIPGAVNNFTTFNFTFNFALPPDFPVVDALTLKNASLTLTKGDGTVLTPILLGDLGPGPFSSPDLQFLSTDTFQSAEFTATLSTLEFALFDGTRFLADSGAIDALLLPSSGNTLVAGTDIAPIAVTGSITVPAVPEPASWLLLVTLLVLISTLSRSAIKHS